MTLSAENLKLSMFHPIPNTVHDLLITTIHLITF